MGPCCEPVLVLVSTLAVIEFVAASTARNPGLAVIVNVLLKAWTCGLIEISAVRANWKPKRRRPISRKSMRVMDKGMMASGDILRPLPLCLGVRGATATFASCLAWSGRRCGPRNEVGAL